MNLLQSTHRSVSAVESLWAARVLAASATLLLLLAIGTPVAFALAIAGAGGL